MNFNPIIPHQKKAIIIAGPCSAESETQILEVAHSLSKIQEVDYMRAGIWKPRTQPNEFEGVGKIGLQWLQRAKLETGLKVGTEIANASHAELALNHQLDMVWIGARTVANPFSIHEIAQALKGCNIPVLIKNPIHPELKLWIGSIERLLSVGITKIAAVHRGFSSFHISENRNEPFWELVFDLKRHFPTLPVITDPSHICGKASLIPAFCQQSIDLEMNGFMIEVHPNPKNAKTDEKQQLSLTEFQTLLQTLVYRNNSSALQKHFRLEQLRNEIDVLDTELIEVLARRLQHVREIGLYKKQHDLTILQINRWKDLVERLLQDGEKKGINREFLLSFLQSIHKESIRIQTGIFGNENKTQNID